jgi:hypothetical protein
LPRAGATGCALLVAGIAAAVAEAAAASRPRREIGIPPTP